MGGRAPHHPLSWTRVALVGLALACGAVRLPAPASLKGYDVVIPGDDTLSRALAEALGETELRVRREVKGGGRPAVVLIHLVFREPGSDGQQWLLGRLADTRSSVILAAATLPLDSLGTSGQARAQALTRALLTIPSIPVD